MSRLWWDILYINVHYILRWLMCLARYKNLALEPTATLNSWCHCWFHYVVCHCVWADFSTWSCDGYLKWTLWKYGVPGPMCQWFLCCFFFPPHTRSGTPLFSQGTGLNEQTHLILPVIAQESNVALCEHKEVPTSTRKNYNVYYAQALNLGEDYFFLFIPTVYPNWQMLYKGKNTNSNVNNYSHGAFSTCVMVDWILIRQLSTHKTHRRCSKDTSTHTHSPVNSRQTDPVTAVLMCE